LDRRSFKNTPLVSASHPIDIPSLISNLHAAQTKITPRKNEPASGLIATLLPYLTEQFDFTESEGGTLLGCVGVSASVACGWLVPFLSTNGNLQPRSIIRGGPVKAAANWGSFPHTLL
jgi:hypothetical protein